MQTFLPYPSFRETAKVLDRKRLGKQRVEAWHIYEIITGQRPGSRWQYHPAVCMWRGYGPLLLTYGIAICEEWRDRGYRDKMLDRFYKAYGEWYTKEKVLTGTVETHTPDWLGREELHASHRASLLMKAPEHYLQFCWRETPRIDYFWPRS